MSLNLHKSLFLYKTPSAFYIQPEAQANEALIIDRQTCSLSLNNQFSVTFLPANTRSWNIYGIVGIKHLLNCPYLIVITKSTQIGQIAGQPVYKMLQVEIIPFSQSKSVPKYGQQDWNEIYVSMLDSILKVPNYYFSYTHDLTNSLQRISANINMSASSYDKRFLWNGHLMADFDALGSKADRYRLPLIHGFISINRITLGYGSITWTLVSRRSVKRAGTRFNRRGIDNDGNVANFVETEQIVEDNRQEISSFIQIRGSIPLKWDQQIDYRYKPPIVIDRSFNHETPLRKHINELSDCYGHVTVVSLIDQRGHEGELGNLFGSTMEAIQGQLNTAYHYFDFHKECSKMRWHRLSILIDRIRDNIDSNGIFFRNSHGVILTQNGVIRSNCIDSLDRTNVVQSMIAQMVLENQLSQLHQVPKGTNLSQYPDFLQVFKNVWADNADALSVQYAGTPALKTDFTRTGQRTHLGLVNDGLNSMTRYVSNNFLDQYRQDAIDLLLGNFEGYPSPLYRPMKVVSYTSPIQITIVLLTLVILYIYIRLN